MIADLKPYPEYKESGVSWLDNVPRHWDVQKPRHIGSLLKGVGGTKEDALPAGVPCVRYGELYTTHTFFVRKPKAFIHPDRASNYMPLRYGDVLFAASGETLEEIGKSAVNLIEGTAVCGGDVIILRPTVPVHAPFLGYVMDSRPSANQKATMGRGTTVKHIYPDELKNLLFPFPPVPEQAAIVRFLDWANGRLERSIRAKRKVIALLNEQKQAVIHRAVTRGLDPSAPSKPTGSRWFPELPEHWEALTLRRVITAAIDGPHFSPRYHDSGIPFLSARNVKTDRWNLGDAKFISQGDYAEFSKRVRPELGDVLYTKGGTTGVARVVDLTFAFQVWVHIAVLKLQRHRVVPAFLAYCLNSPRCHEQAQLYTRGATNQDLGLGRMKEIELPMPPTLEEQNAIVEELDARGSEFSIAISRLEREIELLREYRTRLVADVVTGKLDLREAATRLPDETMPATAEMPDELIDETDAAEEEIAA